MVKAFRAELIDELLAGATSKEAIFGPEGVLKQLTGAIVERALRAELSAHLEEERASSEVQGNRRNGSSKKTLQTEQGPIPLEVPRDRASTFEPQLVPKHATRVPGLDDKILALYARGLSTRDIQEELSTLYHTDVSPMLITRVTDAVHEEITAWRSRPLEALYTVVWLDALMVKMRDEGVVKTRAVHVAVGQTREGLKQVLGMWVENHEGAKFWMRVLSELQQRGVKDILIACCDGLKGFPAAIEAVFPKTVVQTCVVHQVRYSLSFVGWQERKQIADDLRSIYTASSEEAARLELDAFDRKHGERYPMIARSWRANWGTITPFLAFPAEVRRLVYTTNAIESLNYQFRKVIKTKGHFPNEDAALKLLYLALRNAERNWKAPPAFWRKAHLQLINYFGEERMLAK
jgi:putative transposase